jgi:two-component system LytT family response regulator
MKKIFIIDDEIDARIMLREMLEVYPDLIVKGEASSVKEGLKLLEHAAPDVLFLDVNLGDGTGFELLQQLQSRDFILIMVTAYENFALTAFKANALDYILKPISLEDLNSTVEKIRKHKKEFDHLLNVSKLIDNIETRKIHHIIVSNSDGFHYIALDKISCICSEGGNYTYINYEPNTNKILVSKNIGDFEYLTEASDFCRIHQCYIVNLRHVQQLKKSGDGDEVVLQNGMSLSLSRRRKEEFKERMKRLS